MDGVRHNLSSSFGTYQQCTQRIRPRRDCFSCVLFPCCVFLCPVRPGYRCYKRARKPFMWHLSEWDGLLPRLKIEKTPMFGVASFLLIVNRTGSIRTSEYEEDHAPAKQNDIVFQDESSSEADEVEFSLAFGTVDPWCFAIMTTTTIS